MDLKFTESDYLTLTELETLAYSLFPTEKGRVIGNKLINHLLINKGRAYLYKNKNVSYEKMDKTTTENLVIVATTTLLEESFKKLNREERDKIKDKEIKTIFKNSTITTYMPQIMNMITNNKVDFLSSQVDEMHFKNGFYDFQDDKFYKRSRGEDYIECQTYINRKYRPSTKEERKKVLNFINQLYPTKEDRDYILSIYGKALAGHAIDSQTILFKLGQGSSGKSTFLKLLKKCIEDYLLELDSDALSDGNSNINKIINSYMQKPYTRVSWINELKDKKINDSLLKTIVEGRMSTTSLYKDGVNNFTQISQTVMTSNLMPNIKIDSGSSRRVVATTSESLFVKDASKVDESKHIYKAIENVESIFDEGNLLNALFDILASFYKEVREGKVFPVPKNFQETQCDIINTNDTVQDFIDSELILTNNKVDVINKEAMLKHFQAVHPKSHITLTQLLNNLKDKGIKYDSTTKHNNKRGHYVGVKFRVSNEDDFEFEESDLEYENKQLKKKIKELQDIINSMKPPTPPPVAPVAKTNNVFIKKQEKKKEPRKEVEDIDVDSDGIIFNFGFLSTTSP